MAKLEDVNAKIDGLVAAIGVVDGEVEKLYDMIKSASDDDIKPEVADALIARLDVASAALAKVPTDDEPDAEA